MEQLPPSITITIVILTVFFCFILGLKYSALSNFMRTRLMMTAFFFFIVATLTISFWQYTSATLPFTIPAFVLGALIGYFVGVRAAEDRLNTEGISDYMQHFAHIRPDQMHKFTWWSFVNFYSVMGALILINMVGFTNVILGQNESFAIFTSSVGAFLLGTIAPYLIHLWMIGNQSHNAEHRAPHEQNN